MSGYDTFQAKEKLIDAGWTETDQGRFVPPDTLWESKPASFHWSDALELQDFLIPGDVDMNERTWFRPDDGKYVSPDIGRFTVKNGIIAKKDGSIVNVLEGVRMIRTGDLDNG